MSNDSPPGPSHRPPKLPLSRRQAIENADHALVRDHPVAPDVFIPRMFTALVPGLDLADWVRSNLRQVLARLCEYGAVLFRGFGVADPAAFERMARSVAGEPLAYLERSSPRSTVAGRVYTSTDHPSEERIFQHSEQSYNLTFPMRLLFYCETPATEGGATPLSDARRIFFRIPPAPRARLLSRGYLYVRNFSEHLGLPWPTVFQTDDRREVEAYCRRNNIDFEWRSGARLRTRQVRRVAGLHPFTGEPVWFNHATFFHVSTLPPAVGEALLGSMDEEELPNNTYYGDGSPFEPEVLDAMRAAYDTERVETPWRAGDVLLLDNMLVTHGRAPFTGPRRVLASMATAFPWSAVPEIDAGDRIVSEEAPPARREVRS